MNPLVHMNNGGGHPHRISKEQRDEILRVFLDDGLDCASTLAIRLGLNPKYVDKLARERGLL